MGTDSTRASHAPREASSMTESDVRTCRLLLVSTLLLHGAVFTMRHHLCGGDDDDDGGARLRDAT